GRGGDDVDDLVEVGRLDHHFDLHLGDEADLVLTTPEGLALPTLAAVALHLGDGHAEESGAPQGVLHLLELERLDDGCYEMNHHSSSQATGSRLARSGRSLSASLPSNIEPDPMSVV